MFWGAVCLIVRESVSVGIGHRGDKIGQSVKRQSGSIGDIDINRGYFTRGGSWGIIRLHLNWLFKIKKSITLCLVIYNKSLLCISVNCYVFNENVMYVFYVICYIFPLPVGRVDGATEHHTHSIWRPEIDPIMKIGRPRLRSQLLQ